MGKCEEQDHSASSSSSTDHPAHELTEARQAMIQNAPAVDMAMESPTTQTSKTSVDMKSPSVKVKSATPSVKPTTPSVKPTTLQENLASNPSSFLAAIGDSEEYVKPIVKDGEIILEVECGQNKAYLYLSKLCQGSKGPCIFFQTSWLTPNEFQFVSGRETAKDWKRSIRHHGKSLKLLLTKGILSVHPTVCDCEGCRHGSSTPTRCRTGEKRKAPTGEGKKSKKPQNGVEHHTNGAFKPVERSRTESSKPVGDVDSKPPQDQNLPTVSGKKNMEKHCSPLKESKASNVIEAAKVPQCDRISHIEPPVFKKVKVQGQDEVTCEKKITNVENVSHNNIPLPQLPPATVKTKETDTAEAAPEKCPIVVPVVIPEVAPVVESTPQLCVPVVNVPVKPTLPCPEPALPEASSADVSISEPVCVTDSVEVKVEPGVSMSRCASPVIEEANSVNTSTSLNTSLDTSASSSTATVVNCSVNTSVDMKPASPCIHSCPSSPEPSDESTFVCQRTLPVCAKYFRKRNKPVAAERTGELHPAVVTVHDTEVFKDTPKVKVNVTPETKPKAADDTSPKCVRKDIEKVSPRSIPDPRTASEVPHLRQPETGDAAFSDYMRLLAAGHGPQMLHQHPAANMESIYSMRPPEVPTMNPAMLHPLHACSVYSHPGMMQKEQMLYPTTAGALPTSIAAPCFAPLHLMPARMPYAIPQQTPTMDVSRSLQYLPLAGSVPYHCGMAGLKRGSVELDSASALDLSTSKRLRLEYPGAEYRIDSLSGCHGFQPYGFDYSRSYSEELSRKIHAEEAFKANGSLDASSYTPSWMDHAGKAVMHRCTCAESRPGDIRFWSVEDVCRFISILDGCAVYAECFREQRVDGRILPLLTTDHLMKNLGMKLGPALLVTEAVAKKLQEASKYPGCDSCRKLILGVS